MKAAVAVAVADAAVGVAAVAAVVVAAATVGIKRREVELKISPVLASSFRSSAVPFNDLS